MESIWRQAVHNPEKLGLFGKKETQAVVIGGGMAGILTAFFLQRAGVETVVLEQGHIGEGQTGNTTAKITAQHGAIYDRLIRQTGVGKAALYAQANRQAVEEYRRLVREMKIDCLWQEAAACCYSFTDRAAVEAEARAEERLGFSSSFEKKIPLPFEVAGAVRMEEQACFSPLMFLYAVSEGLTIYENTRAESIERQKDGRSRITTRGGSVCARHVVFATHFPHTACPGCYFARLHQERSYVLALEGAGAVEDMYVGLEEGSWSVRSVKKGAEERILLGGGGHRTGGNEGGKFDALRETAQQLWPGCRETARWSAQDCISLDEIPYIGRVSRSEPEWYVATGFGKWGMSHSMVAAMLLTDMILGRENPWEEVFTPARFGRQAAKGLLQNACCSLKGYVGKSRQEKNLHLEDLQPGQGRVLRYGDGTVGAYRDERGELYLVEARCPHMGCELAWNPDERSWDCPCHGSRFGYDGRVLDGPAGRGIGLSDFV